MDFAPVKRQRLADQVAAHIRDSIVGGRFDPGETLPPERELAEQFRVNRSSIREALNRLEMLGLVETRHGGGTRVTDFLTTAGLQLLPYLLAPKGRLDPQLLRDLMELRVLLLGWTAEKAIRNADEASLNQLQASLDALRAATKVEDIQEHDFAFFEQLVAMTGNRVLVMVGNAIRSVYLQNRELFRMLYLGGADTTNQQQTIDALRSRDAPAARAAMEAYGRGMLPTGKPA